MKLLNIVILACGVLSIPGCGAPWLVPPMDQPLIEDKIGKSGYRTLSTTPERRVVIFNENNRRFCAEPSPDVANDLSNAFAAALKGSEGTAEAKANISMAFASTAKQLFQRSQGVQLYRDGMYSLCQSHMNNGINGYELKQMQEELLERASALIEKEIQFLPYIKSDNAPAPVLPPLKDLNIDEGVDK